MSEFFTDLQIETKYIHDANGNCFVYVKHNDDRSELFKVPSEKLERFIRRAFYVHKKPTPIAPKIKEIMEDISAHCLFAGEEKRIYVRVAPSTNGGIEIDLGRDDNACVKISNKEWLVHATPENLFFRPDSQQPLPFPETGGGIDALKNFLNYESEEDFQLMLGFILGAFRPNSTYAHLVLQGEQGCGKTTVTKVIKTLVDNTNGGLRALPRDEQTLFISTQNGHLLCFDNLSGMNIAQSDNFCRLATGGTFGTRSLYTNGEEFTIEARKPVIVNGIDNIATRPDLADRSIILTLPRMRGVLTGEAEFWASFSLQAPAIMGALMDGLVHSIRNHASIIVPDEVTPRTSDFARWAEAGCRGMGLPHNAFIESYVNNRNSAKVDTAFMDGVVMALYRFLTEYSGTSWEGSISELLTNLTAHVSFNKPKNWPTTPVALSNHLSRVAPVLDSIGIEYERAPRTASKRCVILTKAATFTSFDGDKGDDDDADDSIQGVMSADMLMSYGLREYGGELPF